MKWLANADHKKQTKYQKTSLTVGSKDPNNYCIVNNCHHQRCKYPEKMLLWLLKIQTQSYHNEAQFLRAKSVILSFTSNKEMLILGKYHPIMYKLVPVFAIIT